MHRALLLALLLAALPAFPADLPSVETLARQLSDKDPRTREKAARALWDLEKGAEPARAALVAALDDPNPDVVAQAAGALQALGMKEAELVAPRKRVFESPEASLSARFLVSRNLIGHEPAAALVDVMVAYLERAAKGSSQQHNMELARKALGRVAETPDRPVIAPKLAALLSKPEPGVRAAALLALRPYTRDDEVKAWLPRAAALVRDPDSSVRVEALWALAGAAGLAASQIDVVVAALGDSESGVRNAAAMAIGDIGEKSQAIPASDKARVADVSRDPLKKLSESDPDSDVRYTAMSSLRKLASASESATLAAKPHAPGEYSALNTLRAKKVAGDEAAFFQALTEVNVDLIDTFLAAGMSTNGQVLNMGPPLRVLLFSPTACGIGTRPTSANTKAAVAKLISRGADPNGADPNGNTALMEAASHGCDREVMAALLKAGAKVDTKNRNGLTAFELGIFQPHDGLEEIIAAGYRLPAEKAKAYSQAAAGNNASLALIQKASQKK